MDTRMLELQWLSKQHAPMWGGHLERREPISDPQMQAWVSSGIIEAVECPQPGYILTAKGRKLISGVCPTCGRST